MRSVPALLASLALVAPHTAFAWEAFQAPAPEPPATESLGAATAVDPEPAAPAPAAPAPAACPEGTRPFGGAPPLALEAGCEMDGPEGAPLRHGPYQRWHASGALAEEGTFDLGSRSGAWSMHHPDGQLAAQGEYDDGLEGGTWSFWYEDGAMKAQGDLAEGKRVGLWTTWHPNGELAESGSYDAGKRSGEWTFYHENGAQAEAGAYAADRREGAWVSYDEAGLVTAMGNYAADRKTGLWYTWAEGVDADQAALAMRPAAPAKVEPAEPVDPLAAGIGVQGRLPLVLSRDQVKGAEDVPALTLDTIRTLKPSATRLPPNPAATTDFTAYTLEAGQLKVGLLSVGLGLLDNVQVSTMPLLDLRYEGFTSLNGAIKISAVHQGPLHVAFSGSQVRLSYDELKATLSNVGGIATIQILPAWSIHGGATYTGLSLSGIAMLDDVAGMMGRTASAKASDDGTEASAEEATELGRLVTVKAATDIRFNRRDSVILQGSFVPWADTLADGEVDLHGRGIGLPDEYLADMESILSAEGRVPMSTFYTASIAYQLAWKNAHLRVGVGAPFHRLTWLNQTMELSVRFGGKSAMERSRQWQTWRHDKKAVKKGLPLDAGVADGEKAPKKGEKEPGA